LLGISTVFGNSYIETTTKNTLKILELSGIKDVKVFKGAEKPLMRNIKIENAILIHGESGLGKEVKLPEP
jgi:inosine-uridine nucleoside N-ribohydrolase